MTGHAKHDRSCFYTQMVSLYSYPMTGHVKIMTGHASRQNPTGQKFMTGHETMIGHALK